MYFVEYKYFNVILLLFLISMNLSSCVKSSNSESGKTNQSESETANPKTAKNVDITPCIMKFSDLVETGKTLSGTGSGVKKVYQSIKSHTDYYLVKENSWSEAYASTVYTFLIGNNSQKACFIEDGNKIHTAIKIEESFQESFKYFKPIYLPTKHLTTPLLSPGSGLGKIIVASILLGERDLKGLASSNSNLGVINFEGKKIFFKIDNQESFNFNSAPYKIYLDLNELKNPKESMPFLVHLNLEKFVTPGHLQEIKEAAEQITKIQTHELEKILDFCEERLKKLTAYPNTFPFDNFGTNGVFSVGTAPTTYKQAIMLRFNQLKTIIDK
ncbi:hypothetical protein QEJ31_03145 [Pigmentibacter sp. JX0631]|uniref:hypothetical protein n=1 Tax=Pigmentibacter sp. JX0631 TaxID=2976982 RepID=UPI00246826B1|nr:hypothetical protein [Pigmentibacter sp. JX0631]WGL60597.1 hypothetical protein QEJ31_03145 [Pigmentibacter sp. JX0631]